MISKSKEKGSELKSEILAFGRPTKIDDPRWEWRDYLQKCKLGKENQEHTISLISKSENRNCIRSIIGKHITKLGCPQHDLIKSLLIAGIKIKNKSILTNYSFCNGYSILCPNYIKNKLKEIKKISFQELGVYCPKLKNSLCTNDLKITISKNVNILNYNTCTRNLNKNNLSGHNGKDTIKIINKQEKEVIQDIIVFDIMQASGEVFIKKFRPGLYHYDTQNDTRKHRFGSWVCYNIIYIGLNI